MSQKSSTPDKTKLPRWHRGADVPMSAIRRFAREVAQRFEPEKIILFGSHAYGTPHADSDVDILVVMPARNEIGQAVRIDRCQVSVGCVKRTRADAPWLATAWCVRASTLDAP